MSRHPWVLQHLFGTCHYPASFAGETFGFLWNLGAVGFVWTQPHTWRSLPALRLSPALLPHHSWLESSLCGDWEWTTDHDIYRAKINQRKESYPFTGEQAFTDWNIFLLLQVLIILPLNVFLLTPLLIWNITLWFAKTHFVRWTLLIGAPLLTGHWVITGPFPVLSFHCSHHYVHRRSPQTSKRIILCWGSKQHKMLPKQTSSVYLYLFFQTTEETPTKFKSLTSDFLR